jgi:Plasmid encoded RepA protein
MSNQPGRSASGLKSIGKSLPKALKPLCQAHKRLLNVPAPDADFGIIYQHSVLCQTCLPYRNPGDAQRRWTRKNGFLTLELDAGRAFDNRAADFVDVGLPYGPKPRLVLYHLNAEALRTQSPLIELEHSLTGFVKRTLGLDSQGRNIQTVRDQLTRLAACDFRIGKSDSSSSITVHARILNGLKLWTPEHAGKRELMPSQVQFSQEYFESLMQHAVPLNETAVARLSHNAMALDTYAWLAQRLHRIGKGAEARVSWGSLAEQFGAGYAHVREFRRVFKRTLGQVKVVYPDANFDLGEAGMTLRSSRPPVARRLLPMTLPVKELSA